MFIMRQSSFICLILLASLAISSLCYSASPIVADQLQQFSLSAVSQGFLKHAEKPTTRIPDTVEETAQEQKELPMDQLRNLLAAPSPNYLGSISYNTALNLYTDDSLTYFTQTYNITTNLTTFEHGRIDSSKPGNITKYNCILADFFEGKVKSRYLGCTMAYSTNLLMYAFIAFNGSAIKVLTQIAQGSLPADLSAYHQDLLNNNTYLSEDCRFLSVNGNNYNLKGNSMIKLNMPEVNYINTNIHAYQDSVYFLAPKYLYKFQFVKNYLQAKYLLPYQSDNSYGWQFNAYQNRFAISSQKNVSATPVNVLTTLYIIQQSPQNSFELIDILRMNSDSIITTTPIFFSPVLTKLFRKYTDALSGSSVVLLKNIDYQNSIIWDVDTSSTTFLTLASGQQFDSGTFSLTDQFMAVRIDDATITFAVLEGFQFIGSTLNYIQTSISLPLTSSPIQLSIDPTLPNNLTLNVVTNDGTSLTYDQICYGAYTGQQPTQPSQQDDSPFLKLKASPENGIVISTTKSLETLEVFYNINASQTQLTYKKINPFATNALFAISSLIIAGDWLFVSKSKSTLSCSAFYQNSSQSVTFVRVVYGSLIQFQQISLSTLQGFPQQYLLAANYDIFMKMLTTQTTLGENCEIVFMGNIYSLTDLTQTVLTLPNFPNTEQPSFSPDIKYLASYRVLQFAPRTGDYKQVLSIVQQCEQYQNFYYHNRLIILCFNVFLFDSTQLTNNIYVFVDYNNGEFHLLDSTSFMTSLQRVVMSSEQLTKLYVQDSSSNLCKFFNIDFDYGQISQVFFQTSQFCETATFISTTNQKYDNKLIYIGEHYVVIRNDSDPTVVPCNCYEESYQFMGLTIKLLASNPVPMKDQYQCIRTLIDQDIVTELNYYSYYENNKKGAGYNVYRTIVPANFYTPVPVGNWLLTLNQSIPDGQFITSEEQVQTFQVIYNPVWQASSFRLAELDETKPKSISISSVQADGQWMTLLTAKRTALSCMLVVQPSSQTYMFLRYSNQVLSIYKTIFKTELPVELSSLSTQQMTINAKLGEDCSFFASNGYIYPLDSAILTATNMISSLNIASMSNSMNYLILANSIMKYSQQLNSYVSIYTIPGSGTTYGYFSSGNRFLVYSFSSVDATPIYNLDYTFTIFVDNDWSVQTIGTFSLGIQSINSQLLIDVSPKLTKIYLQYTDPLSTQPTFILKNIDYTNYYIFDVSFVNLLNYQQTTANLNYWSMKQPLFLLEDQYLIVRNDSGTSTNNYVEQGYQFVGNDLVLIGQRLLSNFQLYTASKINIDPSVSGFLNVLSFYPKYRVVPGFYVYKNSLGSINNSNPTITLPQTPPYFVAVNNSRAENAFFSPEQSLEFFDITPRPNNNQSQLTYSRIPSKDSAFLVKTSIDLAGSWSTVRITNKTLKCVLVYESYSQTYSFFALSASNISLVSSIHKNVVPPSFVSQLSNNSKLAENCRLLMIGSVVFYNFNFLQVAEFSSSDLLYLIATSQLYKFNETSSSYSQIYSLPVWSKYEIYNHQDRLMIVGQNVTQPVLANQVFNHNFAIYVLIDSFSIIQVVDIISFTIQTNTSFFPIHVSPNLTKIHFHYLPLKGTARINVFKTVDYANMYVFDVDVLSQASLDIISSLQDLDKTKFVLGDRYLIVRNDTYTNVLANTIDPSKLLIEAGFQFMNTSLVTSYSRVLSSFQIRNCHRIFINQTSSDLLAYDFIAKTRIGVGYYLNQTTALAYAGASLPFTVLASSVFAETNQTQSSNTFKISNNTASLQYWSNTTGTYLKYIKLDRTKAGNITSQLFSLNGTWQLISSSTKLTCNLFTSSNSFIFVYYNGLSFVSFGPFNDIFNTSTLPLNVYLNDDCSLFSASNIFYVIRNSSIFTVATNITLSPSLPHTDSFDYVILGNQLFALTYDGIQYSFTSVFSPLPSASNCKIQSYDIIVMAVCSTAKPLGTVIGIDVTIFMWADFSPLMLVSNKTYSHEATNSIVSIAISPKVSKILYSYTTPTKILTPVLIDVSLELGTFTDLPFLNTTAFNQTAAIWNNRFNQSNFHLADRFLVIRNDSYIAATSNTVFAEQAYYFNQTNVAILGTRALSHGELFKCQNIYVDQNINDRLSLLISYPKSRLSPGYRFYEMSYGSNLTIPSYNSTNTTSNSTSNTTNSTATTQTVNGLTINSTVQLLPPPSVTTAVIATFYNSTLENQFIQSKKMESLEVNHGVNVTNIVISYLDRNSITNVTSVSTTLSGLWSLYLRSTDTLSCLVFTDSTFSFFSFLKFSYTDNLFSIVNTISLSAFMPYAAQQWFIGEECNLAKAGNTVFNIVKSTATGLKKVSTPASWQVSQQSASLIYAIATQTLYGYDSFASTYTQIASLLPYQSYKLVNFQDRLLITGSNSTMNTSGTFTSQRVWVMVDGNILDFFDIKAASNVTIIASPELSKVYCQYTSNNGSTAVVVKSVDYSANVITDYLFTDLPRYLETINGISQLDTAHFAVGQFYIAVRNDTSINSNNSYEEAYEYVGTSIMLLRSRALSGLEVGTSYRMAIDDFYENQLIIVDYYPILNPSSLVLGYNLNAFGYGNMATTVQVATHLIPPYINFTSPIFSQSSASLSSFEWTYLSTNILSHTTTFLFYTSVDNSGSNIVNNNFTISGLWRLVGQSSACKLVQSRVTNDYYLYWYRLSSNLFTVVSNVTASISAVASNITSWKFADDCSRIVGQDYYLAVVNSTSTSSLVNNSWIAVDSSTTYAYDALGIWKFSAASNKFQLYRSGSLKGLSSNVVIMASGNALVIYSTASQSVYFYAFSNNGSALTLVFNTSNTGFTAGPTLSLSSSLINLVIYGGNVQDAVLGYYINYSSKTYQNISIPQTDIISITKTIILIEDSWLYIRQLATTSNLTNGNLQFIYAIQQNVIPVLIKTQNISDYDSTNWLRSKLLQLSNGNIKALSEVTSSTKLVLRLELAAVQSAAGTKPMDAMNTVVVDGLIRLCKPGCDECSQGICSSCLSGYVYSSNNKACLPCGTNCRACSMNNLNNCTSCVDGSYLNGSVCLNCDPSCNTCAGSATSCKQCLPRYFFNANASACQVCPRNCLTCSSSGFCLTCFKGFTQNNGTCRGCSISCSDCSPLNIMSCTSCANGLELINQACVSCPLNCATCKNGKCGVCVSGYRPNSNGQCVKNCDFPCSNCSDSNPFLCTSCYYGWALNGTTCKFDLSCNSTFSCNDCGVGTGFFLVGASCLKCGIISNCLQCADINSQLCAICQAGYYLRSNICVACPNICSTCVGALSCTSCITGYTLVGSNDQSQCIACQSPCLTCQNFKTYCTSCIAGYKKMGWKCQININVGFVITLSTDVPTLLASVDVLVRDLLKLLGLSSDEIDAITFSSFVAGSAVVSGLGSVGGSASATVAATSALSSGLSGSSVGGFTITSSSVVTNGVDSGSTSNINMNLVIGLCLGIPLFILAIGLILYCSKKDKDLQIKPQSSCQQQYDTKDKNERSENIIVSNSINQRDFMSVIKEESMNQSHLEDQIIDRGPNYREIKFPFARVEECGSMQDIKGDSEVRETAITIPANNQKQKVNKFQLEIEDIGESVQSEMQRSDCPVVVAPVKADNFLKVEELEIEQYDTVYLQPQRRIKKQKYQRPKQKNEESSIQDGKNLMSISESPTPQSIIFVEPEEQDNSTEMKYSKPPTNLAMRIQQFSNENEPISQEKDSQAESKSSRFKEKPSAELKLESYLGNQRMQALPSQLSFYQEQSN